MCPSTRKDHLKRFLNTGIPIESHLHLALPDHINTEVRCTRFLSFSRSKIEVPKKVSGAHVQIVAGVITNKQDCLDWLTWTWMFRRLTANANYYNMQGTTHQHVSDHLSELVENATAELANSKAIAIEDECVRHSSFFF